MVQYQGDDNWYDCPENGSIKPSATSPFSSGSILCPKFHEVCTGLPEISPVDAVQNKETGKNVEDPQEGKSTDNTTSSRSGSEDDEDASPASVLRELPTKEDKLEEKYTIVTKRANDWKPIRIHASTEAVDAAVEKCKDWAAKATVKPVRGDTFQPDPDALDYPPPTKDCTSAGKSGFK
ncbi:Peptidase M8 [Trypanosoma melophagium]|uniref:Peptidase M8 n=1 Tax=Trypanosoma melophagium TaxID=715481 RepID=UPI00351A8C0C|nr:Peptidase M8 [Trypanosoma melophagium]